MFSLQDSPQVSSVKIKNRDLKPKFAILVGDNHTIRSEKLAHFTFALNAAKFDLSTQTAAFLLFGRELRTLDNVHHDIRSVIVNDNFVTETTKHLRKFENIFKEIKIPLKQKQNQRNKYIN
ncbi:reverse transcriptase [Caerostris extrusa]|uniref:Reverse transcriptase n=1 Tax=Caerostris extrusa TaxID=172846 RepID=A0AAV4QMQ6_CAEEX|nr:reverse transcriptase [Caerostris extrusa]